MSTKNTLYDEEVEELLFNLTKAAKEVKKTIGDNI